MKRKVNFNENSYPYDDYHDYPVDDYKREKL